MIITISGTPGSGKSTIARGIAKKFNIKHYSIGDLMRSIAKEKGISLQELSDQAKEDKKIDFELDEETKKLAKKDNFVIDSRLGFHFISKSIKIFVKADLNIAVKRIYKDIQNKERETEKDIKTLSDALKKTKERMKSECDRYKKYYGLNYLDESNYDFVIDTTEINAETAVERIEAFLKKKILKQKISSQSC